MKKNTRKFLLVGALIAITSFANAQEKIGDNETIINKASLLELESTNKGLLIPRVELTNTTTWSLITGSTPAAGMVVYNTKTTTAGFAGTVAYPLSSADGTGLYYWDGTGWVATKGAAAASGTVYLMVERTAVSTTFTASQHTLIITSGVDADGTTQTALPINSVVITLPPAAANKGKQYHVINASGADQQLQSFDGVAKELKFMAAGYGPFLNTLYGTTNSTRVLGNNVSVSKVKLNIVSDGVVWWITDN